MLFHSSVIFVKDIERSKRFYTTLLDQEIILDFGKNVTLNGGLALWELRDEHVITKNVDTTQKTTRFELYFEHSDIDEAYAMVKREGCKFLHEIHEEPWGQRTIRFFDPDGHLVEIGEPLPVFLKRMLDSDMSPQEVAEKSHVPLETLRDLLGEDLIP